MRDKKARYEGNTTDGVGGGKGREVNGKKGVHGEGRGGKPNGGEESCANVRVVLRQCARAAGGWSIES